MSMKTPTTLINDEPLSRESSSSSLSEVAAVPEKADPMSTSRRGLSWKKLIFGAHMYPYNTVCLLSMTATCLYRIYSATGSLRGVASVLGLGVCYYCPMWVLMEHFFHGVMLHELAPGVHHKHHLQPTTDKYVHAPMIFTWLLASTIYYAQIYLLPFSRPFCDAFWVFICLQYLLLEGIHFITHKPTARSRLNKQSPAWLRRFLKEATLYHAIHHKDESTNNAFVSPLMDYWCGTLNAYYAPRFESWPGVLVGSIPVAYVSFLVWSFSDWGEASARASMMARLSARQSSKEG